MIPATIFKSYDIRGIYPDEINEQNIDIITKAIFKVIYEKIIGQPSQRNLKIALGHDMRLSAPKLYPLVKQALVSCGVRVIDIGLVSTPTMYFAGFNYDFDAAIMLSASHNPPKYTGFKMVMKDPKGVRKVGKGSGMEEIKKAALESSVFNDFFNKLQPKKGTVTLKSDVLTDEIKNAKKIIDFSEVKPLKVVADGANAMGSLYIEALFKELPCNLIPMNFKLDGSFPAHPPDPLIKENLQDLQKRVLKEKADVGRLAGKTIGANLKTFLGEIAFILLQAA